MLENPGEILANVCKLEFTSPIVVGVSGGPDSLCLLHSMHVLGYELVVAHFDHGLRPESAADAQKVEEIAGKLGLAFELEREDVGVYAKENGLSIEEAARERRYAFLYKLAEKYKAQAVAVGHNADDQVETVLMHLLRGAGLDGLSGMRMRSFGSGWSQTIPLVRPLLETWREQILAYCKQHELEPVFDRSNLDTTYFRNRLRHELLPNLESYNPQIQTQFLRMAETLSGDQQIIEQHIDAVWERVLAEFNQGYLAMNSQAFLEESLGVQRRLLRRALTQLRPGLRDLDLATVTRAIEAIQSPPASGQCDLMAGLRLVIEEDRFWLAGWEVELPVAADWPQLPVDQPISLNIPGEIAIGAGWYLKAEQCVGGEVVRKDLNQGDPFQVWLAVGKQIGELTIRSRQPGDRFAPLGLGGHTLKVSDFLINQKLPQRARAAWPLVCAGDEIAWIPGFRPSHLFRVESTTEKVLHLEMHPRKE